MNKNILYYAEGGTDVKTGTENPWDPLWLTLLLRKNVRWVWYEKWKESEG